MKRILIVKTSALGDLVHTFPAVFHLRRTYPDAVIDWVVEKPFVELIASHPDISNVLSVDTKTWRRSWWKKTSRDEIATLKNSLQRLPYDLVIDFQGNTKSGLITWLAAAKRKVGFGKKTVAELPNLLFSNDKVDPPPGNTVRDDYLALAAYATQTNPTAGDYAVKLEGELPPIDGKEWALVCPGARWANKQLTQETLSAFLQHLNRKHHYRFLLLWGNEQERQVAEALKKELSPAAKILPRLPLPTLQQLMGQVELVVAMDSLPLHLAATTGTPTFSFFGPSSAMKYAPKGEQHGVFQGACPYGKKFEKRCPILRTCRTGACLREVDIDDLTAAFDAFLEQQITR